MLPFKEKAATSWLDPVSPRPLNFSFWENCSYIIFCNFCKGKIIHSLIHHWLLKDPVGCDILDVSLGKMQLKVGEEMESGIIIFLGF